MKEFMKQWGDEIILATAVFWADRVEWDEDGKGYAISVM